MKTNFALLAAAKVIERNPDFKDAAISVDGVTIDKAQALAALADASPSKGENKVLAKVVAKLSKKQDHLEEKLEKNKAGRTLKKVLNARPEWVNARVTVHVVTAEGKQIDIPVRVTDRKLTNILQGASLTAEGFALSVPIFGFLGPLSGAALAIVGSYVAKAVGHKPLADSLKKMAGKHALLGTLTAPPVFGEAMAAFAVLNDAMHVTRSRAVSVAELENVAKDD